jgi:hypothetical protein
MLHRGLAYQGSYKELASIRVGASVLQALQHLVTCHNRTGTIVLCLEQVMQNKK